jgi:hypothetical protein
LDVDAERGRAGTEAENGGRKRPREVDEVLLVDSHGCGEGGGLDLCCRAFQGVVRSGKEKIQETIGSGMPGGGAPVVALSPRGVILVLLDAGRRCAR